MPASRARLAKTFEPYQSIIDDWNAFLDVMLEPLPACIWTNTLRTSPDYLEEHLPIDPLPWYPGAFRCRPGWRPAARLEFAAGLYQLQEEAAMAPIFLLNPKPGDRVLDLCAAPGNKTTQIAVALQNEGFVLANDRSHGRLGILVRSINRMGLTNTSATVQDATSFPSAVGQFDHVLADVPCSGEGTARRYKAGYRTTPERRMRQLQRIQGLILDRAIRLCKPGGQIAYATCTFNPGENEAIVNAALETWADTIRVIPAEIEGLETRPGLTEFDGQSFNPALAGALRLWPHHNDTGGFFVCMLEKRVDAEIPGKFDHPFPNTPTLAATDAAVSTIFQPFVERFGFPDQLGASFSWTRKQNSQLFFHRANLDSPQFPEPVQLGLPLVGKGASKNKMKTAAGLKFARLARRHVVDLDRAQADRILQRQNIEVSKAQLALCEKPGFVILRHDGYGIGMGLLRMNEGEARIESQLPKQWVHNPEPAIPIGSGS